MFVRLLGVSELVAKFGRVSFHRGSGAGSGSLVNNHVEPFPALNTSTRKPPH